MLGGLLFGRTEFGIESAVHSFIHLVGTATKSTLYMQPLAVIII